MPYFIGVVPPVEDQRRIQHFRERWRAARHGTTEPHVTVKAQGGLTEDLRWLVAVREVCSTTDPIPVETQGPAVFGASVVYLRVSSVGLRNFHHRLVEAVSPSFETLQQYFEGDLYVPHLTLGQSAWGLTDTELREMYENALSERLMVGPFLCSQVRIFRGQQPGGYEPYVDIPLG